MNQQIPTKTRFLEKIRGFLLSLLFTTSPQEQTDIIIPGKNNSTIVDIDALRGVKNNTIRFDFYTLNIIIATV